MPANNNPKSAFQNPQSPTRGVALKECLVGGKIGEIRGGAQSATTVSYFKGNDPSKWKSNIAAYEVVDMGEVYKGIGLSLKAYGNNVEKLFCVKPGASPERIKIRLDGLKECGVRSSECGVENSKFKIQNSTLQINDAGELVAETELGPVKFTKPVAYQEIDGKRVVVAVEYRIQESGSDGMEGRGTGRKGAEENPKLSTPNSELTTPNSQLTYGFTVASYDKTKDLIIDPLLASTFLGGYIDDRGESLVLDPSGNVYVTGQTESTNFPTTSGAYDTSYNGSYDVFVSKLDSGLTSLLASTYMGGSSDDEGDFLALDPSGNVYVTGFTQSTNFPTTS
ncbi:MAG: SBBP repeat-containing protein, partial [Thermodesulfobacteriota bacterium]